MKGTKVAIMAFLLGASGVGAAPAPWIEIRSDHFTVVTNSGEKAGRRTAWQFEQIRQALKLMWPWAVIDGGNPMTIFAVRDEATLKSLGPQYWEGKRYRPTSFWVSGSDRNYIALRTDLAEPDDVGENPYQTAYWNYVSLVLRRSLSSEAPYWYSRGLASVMSNTIVRDKEIHVGRLIRSHLDRVRETSPIPLAEFLAVDRESRYAVGDDAAYHFDSQAWAFVHYLLFANKGEHSDRLGRFNHLLLQGAQAPAAMKEAFGADMSPYFAGMRDYLKKAIFQYARLPVALDLKTETFAARAVAEPESLILRAHVLLAMSRPVEARLLAAEASKLHPGSAGPSEIEALLLEGEGKSAEAVAAYRKAVEAGSTRGQVYYRLAQLTRPDSGTDKESLGRVAALLVKATELDPKRAGAYSFLADVRTDEGQPDLAIPLAQKATTIEPDSSYHQLALARALWNAQRADEALKAARSALNLADSPRERDYAQRFLDFAMRAGRPAPVPSPAEPPRAQSQAGKTPEPSGSLPAGADLAATPAPVRLGGPAADVGNCFTGRNDADCARAVPSLQAACDAQGGDACRSLGSLYDGGFGVAMSKKKAGEIYDFGCRQAADLASCARYAVLQAQGLVPTQGDGPNGLAALEKLCGEEVDDACIGLALVLASPRGGSKLPRARALLKTSCEKGNEESCRILKSLGTR